MTEKAYSALAGAIYLARKQVYALTDDDERLRAAGLYEDWTAGRYEAGDIRGAASQVWECFGAHDSAVNPDITPDNAAWFTFWRPLHGRTPETARPFVPVQGSHDRYHAGEYMIYTDGATYQCVQATNFSPEDYPAAWEKQEEPA